MKNVGERIAAGVITVGAVTGTIIGVIVVFALLFADNTHWALRIAVGLYVLFLFLVGFTGHTGGGRETGEDDAN